ncbi:MAG: insulinase family protein, partial [Candidatus Obscuribacterales bacterium]|nr:insulinase family protein [Candidatus Obscuribacterales bacterium]
AEPESPHLSSRLLKNGLKVIIYESHISPVVQIMGSLQAGQAYTARTKPAYSLLASNLLSQGSAKRNRLQLLSLQDDLGIAPAQMLKFQSGMETIDFSGCCLARDLNIELDMLSESLTQPAMDDSSLDRAKQDSSAFLKHSEGSVGAKVDRVLLQGLLDENSPFCPADQTDISKSIASADVAEMQKFFANHIVPSACTLVIAGDCNPEQVYTALERGFGKWTQKSSHTQLHAKIRSQRILRSSLPIKDSKKSSVCFGQIIPMSKSHPEYGSLLVADSILVNHPMFSRFEQALSRNPALESAIAGGDMTVKLEPISNLTRWSLSLYLDPSAVPVSVKGIKTELKQLSKTGVSPEEFREAKSYLLGALPVRTQSTLSAVANSLLESAEHSDTINGYSAEMNSVRNASVDSVNKVIRATFKPEQSTIVIAGAAQAIKSARPQSPSAIEPQPKPNNAPAASGEKKKDATNQKSKAASHN